ncbi:MAG: DUF2062 domain-containing protein [Acidobacteria bacterium]|nr:DUF2062 domain-containing protein [Acidobacteriota bacterium]MCB9398440.1 DUF2062 domain-containing protein [Acidobacteriota bacterium]
MRQIFTRIRTALRKSDSSPHIKALSFSIGAGLAFSPLVGLHLLVVFVLARWTRLNGFLIFTGTLIHNPWTMVPIHFLGLITGDFFLYGHPQSVQAFKSLPWDEFGLLSWMNAGFWQKSIPIIHSLIQPFVIGSLTWSLVVGTAVYFTLTKFVLKER